MQSSSARERYESLIDSVSDNLKSKSVSLNYLRDKLTELGEIEDDPEYEVLVGALFHLLVTPVKLSRMIREDEVISAVLPVIICNMDDLFDIAGRIRTDSHRRAFFYFKTYLNATVLNTDVQLNKLVVIAGRGDLNSRQTNVIKRIRADILTEKSQKKYTEQRALFDTLKKDASSPLTDSVASATFSHKKRKEGDKDAFIENKRTKQLNINK